MITFFVLLVIYFEISFFISSGSYWKTQFYNRIIDSCTPSHPSFVFVYLTVFIITRMVLTKHLFGATNIGWWKKEYARSTNCGEHKPILFLETALKGLLYQCPSHLNDVSQHAMESRTEIIPSAQGHVMPTIDVMAGEPQQ